MRKFVVLLTLFIACARLASAQEPVPRGQVFGGYSFFGARDPINLNLHGWNGSFAGNTGTGFGFVADFAGHYGSPFPSFLGVDLFNTNVHTFLFGPQFVARLGSTHPFVHFLVGGARASAGGFGISGAEQAFAMAVGGGLDFKLTDSASIRAVQADYVMTRFFSNTQSSVRLSAGLVFTFGN